MTYLNRSDAGKQLAEKLRDYAGQPDTIVLGLPRGGVPVAFEVARKLKLPLDVMLVRKLGVPGQEELAMGAISSGGVCVFNNDVMDYLNISQEAIDKAVEREKAELERRESLYRGGRPAPQLEGKTIILVDDGLATGSSMRAAIMGLERLHPARIQVAVPVAPFSACREIEAMFQNIGCLCTDSPEPFYAVGQVYFDFSQTTDQEVQELLEKAAIVMSDE